ncbi:MipA/OmpV family protein, partial [Pseudoalteromonas sp. S4389]
FEYLQDVSGTHNGWVMISFYSQIFPWRNWEVGSGVGLSGYSEDFTI